MVAKEEVVDGYEWFEVKFNQKIHLVLSIISIVGISAARQRRGGGVRVAL
jgi:hypothetical protein